MKKMLIALLVVGGLTVPVKVQAAEIVQLKATAYCYNSGTTATGTEPEEGRTLAGKPEWFGKTAVIWEDKGNGIEPENYIGTYIVEDTGGDPIKNGYVVDIFIKELQQAKIFGTKNVIIQLIDAEG